MDLNKYANGIVVSHGAKTGKRPEGKMARWTRPPRPSGVLLRSLYFLVCDYLDNRQKVFLVILAHT